jgi:hypothetical protein
MHLLCVCVRHNNQRVYPPRLLWSSVTHLVMLRTRRLSRSFDILDIRYKIYKNRKKTHSNFVFGHIPGRHIRRTSKFEIFNYRPNLPELIINVLTVLNIFSFSSVLDDSFPYNRVWRLYCLARYLKCVYLKPV